MRRIYGGAEMSRQSTPVLLMLMAIVLLLLAGCAGVSPPHFGTVGDKFRQALANVDAFCKRYKMGPYLDRNDPESWRSAAATDCEILKVKPYDHAAVLATPEGKFAYSIQLPPPLDKPRVRRSDYRSAEEYFKVLCEKEQGDYILATVDKIRGVVALRTAPDGYRQPLGSFSEENLGSQAGGARPEHMLLRELGLTFVERQVHVNDRKVSEQGTWRRYSADPNKPKVFPDFGLRYEIVPSPEADIAIVWREAIDWSSRNEGIVGNELIIMERLSKRVLGLRRTFTLDDVNLKITDQVSYSSRACAGTHVTDGYELISRVINSNRK